MASLYEMLQGSDARLRSNLREGESVIAVGRCEDITVCGDTAAAVALRRQLADRGIVP